MPSHCGRLIDHLHLRVTDVEPGSAPGERPDHPGDYAAFVLDPDGNNIEAVFHGPAERSAPSVVITPTE